MADFDHLNRSTFGGGGFDVSGYGSPNKGGLTTGEEFSSSKGSSSSNLVPVTIRQILESPEEGLMVGGNLVKMVKVVGIVKNVEVTSTKIEYIVEDWTASVKAVEWIESDKDDSSCRPKVVENTYCKVFGRKRNPDGQPFLFVFRIAPIENMMEITRHFLQVIYVPLKYEQLNQDSEMTHQQPLKVQMSASYGNVDESSSNSASAYSHLNLNPQQMKVYRVLQQCKSESGINSKQIQEMMTVKMPLGEIDGVLEYLISEGHIYATIDDEHFRATDLV